MFQASTKSFESGAHLLLKNLCRSSEEQEEMEGKQRVRRLAGLTNFLCVHYYCDIIYTGILLYDESDLQHAVYWCKDKSAEERVEVLKQFQKVWRYGN